MFLKNGIKLQGYVTAFDSFCIMLTRDGQSQIIYKHAISSIQPLPPVQLFDGGQA
jgi:host factor-I protein